MQDLHNIGFIYYFAIVLFYFIVMSEGLKCHTFYETNKYPLGTKSPYSYVSNNNDSPFDFEGCFPARIWAVVRHGTRNPSRKCTEQIRVNLTALKLVLISHHNAGKGSLCPEVIDSLKTWEPSVSPDEIKYLTHEGEEEMLLLGERFQHRFPKLLPEEYSNKSYNFRFTAHQRTRESARYFTVGLFGRRQSAHVWFPEPSKKDPILRFYKLCKRWRSKIYENADSLVELEKFKKSPVVARMLEDISHRVGLSNPLKFEDAKLIYQTCGFETAWYPKKPSPWCALLAKEDFEVLEFAEDLKYYWLDGYGFPLTYKQACVAVNDMFLHILDDSLPQNTFYFSHSGTILKMLSHLGLYNDSHRLTAASFDSPRLWRTSDIDAFGSNLAFVLYKCDGDDQVLTLHQERPVTIPGCPKDRPCPLELLLDLFKDTISDCHFSDMCLRQR